MIGFMPVIYLDELIYSWICRYYVYSGYPTNKMALEDILYKRHCNPSKEFLGHLSANMEYTIKKIYPIDKLVLEHTMFPQYARFIESGEKKKALYRLGHDFCDPHHLFSILPRNEGDRYLKYCPACVLEDRNLYGEAYWHRKHQIRNMEICVKHRCRLIHSNIIAMSNQTFTLAPAEDVVQNMTAKPVENPLELEFVSYMEQVFESPMDYSGEIPIGTILYYGLQGTKYMASTGRTRNTKQLVDDMQGYYTGIGLNEVASMYQIQRTLLGSRSDFSIVCQIAFFLGMSVDNLLHPLLSKEQILSEQVARCPKGEIPKDWGQYDVEMVPIVEQAAYDIYHGNINDIGRPERISERLINKYAGLPCHRLENMPKCRQVLHKYKESYAQNWARRLVWAYKKIKKEKADKPVFWSDIRQLSGVKKRNADVILPLLNQYTDRNTAEEIGALLAPAKGENDFCS